MVRRQKDVERRKALSSASIWNFHQTGNFHISCGPLDGWYTISWLTSTFWLVCGGELGGEKIIDVVLDISLVQPRTQMLRTSFARNLKQPLTEDKNQQAGWQQS